MAILIVSGPAQTPGIERAFQRWSLRGAEAVLKLRALRASGDLDAYWTFHEAREQERTHAPRYADGAVPLVTSPAPTPAVVRARLRRVK